MNKITIAFEKFAARIAWYSGRPMVFVCALFIVIIWALLGPIFGFSDTWQLVINTGTTIITFLMVFLVQSSQNRDSKALQLKLDELIFKIQKADNIMIDIEELSTQQLDELGKKYKRLRAEIQNSPNVKAKKKAVQDAFQDNSVKKQKTGKQKPKASGPNKTQKKS